MNESVPFPPRTYAEARAYYAEADLKNSMDTSFSKGIAAGKEEEKLANARKMKELGASNVFISQVTGLSDKEIEAL